MSQRLKKLLKSSTDSLEGLRITRYLRFITSEIAIAGSPGLGPNSKSRTGDRLDSCEALVSEGRRESLARLERKAHAMDADAIVGLSISIQPVPGAFIIIATGTAVQIAPAS